MLNFIARKLRRYYANPYEATADAGAVAVLGWRHLRRIIVLVVGLGVVLFGILAAALPLVPGFLIVPIGLAILATEFVWARWLLKRAKRAARGLANSITGRPAVPDDETNSDQRPASGDRREQVPDSGASEPSQSSGRPSGR